MVGGRVAGIRYQTMGRRRRLNEWIPKVGRAEPWVSTRGAKSIDLFIARSSLTTFPLDSAMIRETWLELIKRVLSQTGVDLSISAFDWAWEALEEHLDEVGNETVLASPSSRFVILFHDFPSLGIGVESARLSVSNLPKYEDLYIAPWPRLNFLVIVTHEESIGPFIIKLTKSGG